MSDKKHIDRLFQERLKDFEVTPSDSVWNNISTKLLNNNKNKKGIPIWWRVAGVAAALLLMFTLTKFMQNNNTITPLNETIVDVDSNEENINNNLQDVVNEESTVVEEKNISEDLKSKSSNSSVANHVTTPARNDNSTNESKNKNVIVVVENQNDNTPDINKKNNVIAENTISKLSQEETQNNGIDKAKSDAVLNKDNNTKQGTKVTLADSNVVNKNAVELEDSNAIIEGEKLSLTEEIAAIEGGNIEDTADEKFKRWKAAFNIAPVYFNTLGKGSSIRPQFNNSSKTGNINMSYGISGSYAINKKLSVRAGINKVNLGYSTNNVMAFISVNSPSNPQLLKNIQYDQTDSNLSFISAEAVSFAQVPDNLNNAIKSSIDQKLGFIEIPLELEYNISSKKMGVSLIGGFSALFLSENEIYSVLDGNGTLLGRAMNINTMSFSANFGLGFDYKILDKFKFNLEPVFKYQLNTFNNTSGNFKPYFIGVYSGLSFKF